MFWGLGVTAVITIAILSRVGDWRRDFTTNVASTANGTDLEPLRLEGTVDDAIVSLKVALDSMSNWQLVNSQNVPEMTVIDLVRTTPIFRFKDDVKVSIRKDDSRNGVIIDAVSRSRVGKGDLGQNPRNIRELFGRWSMR